MNSIDGPGIAGWRTRMKATAVVLGVASMSVLPASSVFALNWNNGKDLSFDLDTTLNYSLAMRAEGQDAEALSNINNDDGNRNFDQGDLINNRVKIVMEGDFRYKERFGAFIRGKAFYDWAYMSSNSNDSPLTNNNSSFYGGSLTDTQDFTSGTEDRHGKDAEILDAYAYGSMDIGNTGLELRVGRQAVSWGESLFLFNSIMTAQSPLDATEANVPGVELRDLLLPVGQVLANVAISDNLTLSGYYQWEWDKTRLNESGAFFTVDGNQANDALLDAGENVLLAEGVPASIDHGADTDAKDDGQFGLAVRYVAEPLNYSEFGLYYVNYHEKLPMVDFTPFGGQPSAANGSFPSPLDVMDASAYSFAYKEDVQLLGFSVGTALGDTNVGLEMTYRTDYPVNVKDTSSPFGSYSDADVFQAQLSVISLFPNILTADNLTFMGEIGFNTVSGYEGELVKDETSMGFVVKVIPAWDGIAEGLDLAVPITAKVNPSGTSPVLATFTENANSFGIAFDFTYRAVYGVSLSYTMFTGDVEENSNTDRDFVGLSFKYTF